MPAGRPQKTMEPYDIELRITPPDQQPITDWCITDKTSVVLACEEGEAGSDKKLHYHVFMTTTMSRPMLEKWVYTVARSNDEKGNAVFFSRKTHENTIGYVVKDGNVMCRHGLTDVYITECFEKSKAYKREKETNRKRKQRSRDEITCEIKTNIKKALIDDRETRNLGYIVASLLGHFHDANLQLPMRSQVETIALSLLYPYKPLEVLGYYTSNLNRE